MYNINMSESEYYQRVAINESRGYLTEADFYGTRNGKMMTKQQYENRQTSSNPVSNNPIIGDMNKASSKFFSSVNKGYDQLKLDQRRKLYRQGRL